MGRKRKAQQQEERLQQEFGGDVGGGGDAPPAALSESIIADLDVVVERDEEGGIRIGQMYVAPPPKPALTFDSDTPRLVITQIQLHNFKSYAGVKILGPFCKSFTAIVGPNGSGKSNVIDAMLFVFGYRAQKIRCKKVSVLIHSSENFNNLNSCSVSVFFQQIRDLPGDKFELIPGSELRISRTACSDNSSYYEINGKRNMFKDVAALLRQHGIDLDHNRFLILQGEVEQIALMKPKSVNEHETGMLEYLEDIVGSNRLQEPIVRMSRIVETLSNIRNEQMQKLKILSQEKDVLQAERAKAFAYLELENKLARFRGMELQKFINKSTPTLVKIEKDAEEVGQKLAEVQEKLKNMTAKREIKEKAIVAEAKECGSRTEKKEELLATFNKLDKECFKITEDMKHRNEQRKKNQHSLEAEKKKLDELLQVPKRNADDIEILTGRKETLIIDQQKAQKDQQVALQGLVGQTQELQDQKEVQQNKLLGFQKEINDTKSAFDLAQSVLELYLSQEKSVKDKLEELKCSLTEAGNKFASLNAKVVEMEARIPELEVNMKKGGADLKKVAEDVAAAEAELQRKQAAIGEVRSSQQSMQSRGRMLSALLEQKQEGNLPGIYGRMGDLGAIEQKYDVAVSTACPSLNDIVVDTVNTAQKCIEFLKKNNLGKASFVPLEKQEHWRSLYKAPFRAPENVPRLFDLVRVENETIRTAFYFRLRDTLVADDLTQAMRIAYGQVRYRVVTLKGELIETSGTMSGGGGRPLRGLMGHSVVSSQGAASPGEIHRMQKQVDELMGKVRALRDHQAMLEEELPRMERESQTLRHQVQMFRVEAQATGDQEKSLREQVKQQEKKVKETKPDERKVAQMEAEVKKTKSAYEKASGKTEKIQEEVTRLTNKIQDITKNHMKPVENTLKTVTSKVEKVTKDITSLTVAIKTSKRNAAKSQEKINSLEVDVSEAALQLQHMSEKRKELDSEGQELLAKMEVYRSEIEEYQARLAELNQDKKEVAGMENEAKKESIDLEAKKSGLTKKVNEIKTGIVSCTKKLKQLKVHNLETGQETPLEELDPERLDEVDENHINNQLTNIDEELKSMHPNLGVIAEYRKKEDDYLKRVSALEEVTRRRDNQRKQYDDLRKQRLSEFMSAFGIVTVKLKEVYQMITLGGDAELELVDSMDPFSEGIVFSVRPPKKSWKHIGHLSGGEKTLASLALVFALHYYKPSPLYVMDEIDAALDFKNVYIVANYVKEQTKNAQFIIISLRSNMFEEADRLVGIYKTYNCSKSVTINPKEVEAKCVHLAVARAAAMQQASRAEGSASGSLTAALGVTQNTMMTTQATVGNPKPSTAPVEPALVPGQADSSSERDVEAENIAI